MSDIPTEEQLAEWESDAVYHGWVPGEREEALIRAVRVQRAENERLTCEIEANNETARRVVAELIAERDALVAEVERRIVERDAKAAVTTRVRERAAQLSKLGSGLKPDYAKGINRAADELLALLDSPSTEETAECVNCGGPMPGRRPGDVCRDCQGRVPNTEEQTNG